MGRRCFISCKTEDFYYKEKIQTDLKIDMIDHSLNDAIDSEDEDYIMSVIRKDYLSNSTVTIHLIGPYSGENRGKEEQTFIKRELQGSLYNGEGNTKNGILGVVLPSMYDQVYRGASICNNCGNSHNTVIVDNITIKEFSYNYYIPNGKCSHSEDERYCVLVKWDDFILDPEKYIEMAFEKRTAGISAKTRVRPE